MQQWIGKWIVLGCAAGMLAGCQNKELQDAQSRNTLLNSQLEQANKDRDQAKAEAAQFKVVQSAAEQRAAALEEQVKSTETARKEAEAKLTQATKDLEL